MTTHLTPNSPICPLAVSERDLSALRDEAVTDAKAARLNAHVETCPACRERMASFERVAAVLRSERPPEPGERLWRAFAAGSSASRPSIRMTGVAITRQTWNRLGAVAAVLLLTVGFLTVLSLHHTGVSVRGQSTATLGPTATATADLLPAHPLSWSPTANPSPGQVTAFADDGESAYACSVTDNVQVGGLITIWRTSDRGASWVPAQSVPAEPTANGCELVVDGSDPSVAALAWSPRGGGAGDPYTGLMTTVDGGATWQAQPAQPYNPPAQIDQLDSRGGVIYALRETVTNTGALVSFLWASSDGMRSWRRVDSQVPTPIVGFWLQPDGAGILVVTSLGLTDVPAQLWRSSNDGARWTQVSVPGGLPSSFASARYISAGAPPNDIVARWVQSQLHICVSSEHVVAASYDQIHSPVATCSNDGGVTWQTRPLLVVQTSETASVAVNLVAIADDGSPLASGSGALYRLSSGTGKWQSLGAQPQPLVTYCSAPGSGLLWAIPSGPPATDGRNFNYTASYTP